MIALFDTGAVIRFVQDDPEYRPSIVETSARLVALGVRDLCISAVTVQELSAGALRLGSWTLMPTTLARSFRVLSFDSATALTAGFLQSRNPPPRSAGGLGRKLSTDIWFRDA